MRVQVQMYGTNLPQETYQKYLGIIFDENGIEWNRTVEENTIEVRKMVQWLHIKGMNINGWRPASNRAIY